MPIHELIEQRFSQPAKTRRRQGGAEPGRMSEEEINKSHRSIGQFDERFHSKSESKTAGQDRERNVRGREHPTKKFHSASLFRSRLSSTSG